MLGRRDAKVWHADYCSGEERRGGAGSGALVIIMTDAKEKIHTILFLPQ